MTYVYILRSLGHTDRHYVGVTADLRTRLKKHNACEVSHTSKSAPWAVNTYVAFSDEKQAIAELLQRSAFDETLTPRRSAGPAMPDDGGKHLTAHLRDRTESSGNG